VPRSAAPLLHLLLLLPALLAGCASSARAPSRLSTGATETALSRPAPVTGHEPDLRSTAATATLLAEPAASPPPDLGERPASTGQRSLLEECRLGRPDGETGLDAARRRLHETLCGANLWFDGLFGGEPDVRNARAISGRVELSGLRSESEGTEFKARLRLNYDLPNLERRVRIFLDRDDADRTIADRTEGLAIRSAIFDVDGQDDWLAGLGWSPPGKFGSKFDLRLGAKVKSAPVVYVQGRFRANRFFGDRSVLRFRETLFWENREDGFGATTGLDFDHVLANDRLLRLGAVGTVSQDTEGLQWRINAILYRGLPRRRALAWQYFARGATDAEILIREYGLQAIYRRPAGKPYLFAELLAGWSWPRFYRHEPRDDGPMVGFGLELQFGREPF
jgi:hypothetical protein